MADQAASSNEVMTIYNKNNPLKVGDTVYISGRDLTIVGGFSEGMFPDDVTVICPQALFDRLVGAQNYNMIGVFAERFSNRADCNANCPPCNRRDHCIGCARA